MRAGTPAVFLLASISSVLMQECVLTALASNMEVIATLRIAKPVDEQLSVYITASVTLNCALLTLAVPPSTPDGSLVIINNVWVVWSRRALRSVLTMPRRRRGRSMQRLQLVTCLASLWPYTRANQRSRKMQCVQGRV